MLEKLGPLVSQSFSDPREAIKTVLGYNFSFETLMTAAAACACIGAVLQGVSQLLVPPTLPNGEPMGTVAPIFIALMQFGVTILLAGMMHSIGRAFGGGGDAMGALSVSVWWSVLQTAALPVSLILTLIIPPFAGVFIIGVAFWLFWIVAVFVAVLHGFQSPAKVLFSMIGLMLGVSLIAAIAITAISA